VNKLLLLFEYGRSANDGVPAPQRPRCRTIEVTVRIELQRFETVATGALY